MKIKELRQREAFDEILVATLTDYYVSASNESSSTLDKRDFYIYPFLNVLVRPKPDKRVKQYILREYTVNGATFRNLFAKLYIDMALNFPGLFTGVKKMRLPVHDGDKLSAQMIFPCNKKIRIFDFEKGEVAVLNKQGFPTESIDTEIKFRKENKSVHVPRILRGSSAAYVEHIIKGVPLARMDRSTSEFLTLRKKALHIVQESLVKERESIGLNQYVGWMQAEMERTIMKLKERFPALAEAFQSCFQRLSKQLKDSQRPLSLLLSHGDLHPGNVWIEQGSQKIVIIDWETVSKRSVWYDRFTLFGPLRDVGGIEGLLQGKYDLEAMDLIGDHQGFTHNEILSLVLLEDMKFRVDDYTALPGEMGRDDLNDYLTGLNQALSNKIS